VGQRVTVLLLGVIAFCLSGLVLIATFQRRFIYQRRALSVPPRVSLLAVGGQFLEIETADGERLVAWHKPPTEGRPIVIFFHGSADNPDHRAVRFMTLISGHFGVLAAHFRGYGKSTGTPSEVGLYRDAEAIYQYCSALYGPELIVLWGFSLGSAVAVKLASRNRVAALVLEAAFTSLSDVAKHWAPFLPFKLILRDQFEADKSIKSVKAPILMLHGGADRDVPIDLGKHLFHSAPEPKKFVQIDAGGHDDLDKHGATNTVRLFLARLFDYADKASN
jgi:uncharacterized protein